MVRAHQPLSGTVLGVTNRVAGMNADIAQRMQVTPAVTSHDDRAAVGVEPEVAAILGQSRHVVCRYPGSGKNALALGGKDAGFAEQSGIGHDLARAVELFAESGDAGWKIHRKFS